jgi:hypothetical protein
LYYIAMNILKIIALQAFLFGLAYVQNMAFTWSSRTRNQNDLKAHRNAAICSNGVWFLMQVTIWGTLWQSLTHGHWGLLVVTGLTYITATTEGSVHMMKILINKETKKLDAAVISKADWKAVKERAILMQSDGPAVDGFFTQDELVRLKKVANTASISFPPPPMPSQREGGEHA